ncbi:hypothetical protein CBR_g23861 [Chara braunii]|uniref:Carbohydrate kinase PfkB domain-containing protein n=1 Tax=Chara braunii TaxID=69332 RepID=A0A388L591_CHABU|nr:hypothetical protein CBR_g23861 [Chara braunii]|eukprot:GBG77412.1 hypothetical protein CBR_g23861 [Chara braunii]
MWSLWEKLVKNMAHFPFQCKEQVRLHPANHSLDTPKESRPQTEHSNKNADNGLLHPVVCPMGLAGLAERALDAVVGDRATMKKTTADRPVLLVGNYCHDTLHLPSGNRHETLGGSVSFVTRVFDSVGVECRVMAKVGDDFCYSADVHRHPPRVVGGVRTTKFVADLTGGERSIRLEACCEVIRPEDIPVRCDNGTDFGLGMAIGVAGEITPETLEAIMDRTPFVVCDLQALIREVDPSSGEVSLCHLEQTPFARLLHRISFLKATKVESCYMKVDSVRKTTCVVVTDGKRGCNVFYQNHAFHVPAFPAQEVDPTGAGDCFLAGFVAGLCRGLSLEKAALMGNYFGGIAVAQVGVPVITEQHVREWEELVKRVSSQRDCPQIQMAVDNLVRVQTGV